MIANTLIFLLGVLVTALAAMVLSPLFWRKAQSLARRDFEATIPISANEIRAEFDRVRAEAAVSVRRQEIISAETREKAAKIEADRGRFVVEAAELQKRNRILTQTVEELELELEATRTALSERDAEVRSLTGDLSDAGESADQAAKDFEILDRQFRELDREAQEQSAELIAARAQIERLEARLDPADERADDEDARVERLAVEIAALQQALRQERAAASRHDTEMSTLASRLSKTDGASAPRSRETSQPDIASRKSAEDKAGPLPGAPSTEPHRSGSPRFEAALGRRELAALGPSEQADIRERISDVAARVIRLTAIAEGPNSPLASLLEATGPGDAAGTAGPKPTLADRVRLLAEAERPTDSQSRLR